MRTIRTHEVNLTNRSLEIRVVDEPGAGGANHHYEVWVMDKTGLDEPKQICDINFQNGPILEHGVNGVTQEVLLAIVADRLQCFGKGPFPSRENAVALTHVETAMLWLQKRTMDRLARGVEGKTLA
jgi:hypothetical protein